ALNSGKGIKINKKGEASFAEIRKFLGVDLTHEFNLEEAGRKGLKANTVSIQLSQDDYIGEVWHEWDANTQNDFINHVLRTERLEDLLEILRNSFGLDEGQAQNCAQLDLPNGYGHLSLRAIKKILPELKKGLTYDKACLQADENYRHSAMDGDGSLDKLPYYGELLKNSCIGADPKNYSKKFPEKYYGKITNPTIHIGLNQIRKLVNALIEKYGKPSEVHIELARELKIGREEKRKIKQEQKKNRARNEEINEILRERGEKVNYENRLKFKLWEELSTNPLQRCCPFTGKPISIKMLFTEQVEIEHLLPLAITFDDSPANKVVCLRSANRFKSRKSPYDAFSSSPEGYDWNAIYARSRYLPDNKKWRFERDAMDKFNEDEGWHHDRHLIDTQYFARITRRYLTHICPPNKIVGIPGRLTAWLRKKWGLNNILGERNKNRGDHRHHAIDAFVVGCTTRSTLQAISSAVDESRNRVIDEMPLPFPHYRFESIKQSILGITVSFKQDHGISSKKKQAAKFLEKGNTSGELTKGTAYGHVGNTADGLWLIATRKKTEDVTPNHKTIQEIAEPRIRDELKRALDELLLSCSKDDLKREWQAFLHDFSRGNNQLKNKSAPDGIGLPVRHVRLHERRRAETLVGVKQIGQSEPYKYYGVGENAWIDIYCPLKGKDKGKWKGEIANIGNAHDLEYKPCWQLPPSPPARFVMRLRKSDVVMIRRDGEEVPHVVYGIAESGQITLRPHYDALTKDESKKANILISPVASGLRDRCGRKISVDILGRIKDPGSARGKSWE
ncbi:MAG: type II CRISPR RNA-guided endonuclease Cas9, partial [Opitutales bacterium]|nr:type II CRISPR RNA-guided endonuclease Cas9 [Opitutales bacterium]